MGAMVRLGCRVPIAIVLAVLVAGGAVAKEFPRCAPGAFRPLVHPLDGTPLAGASSIDGAFVVGEDTVTLGACGPTPARIHATRRSTTIKARWDECGSYGKVRLRSWLNYPPCKALVGILRWRAAERPRRAALKFESLRIE
jgi:hypothetical protein